MNKLNTLISLSSVLLTGYVIKRANREIKKAVMTSEAGLEIINRQRKMIDRYSDVVDMKNERIEQLLRDSKRYPEFLRSLTEVPLETERD